MSVYLLVLALHLDFCRFPWIPVDKLFILLSKANPPFSFRTWLEQICPFSPGSLIFPSLNGQLHAVVLKRAVHATIVKFSVDPPISLTLLHFSVPLYRIKCPQKSYLCPSYSRPRSSSFQLDLCPSHSSEAAPVKVTNVFLVAQASSFWIFTLPTSRIFSQLTTHSPWNTYYLWLLGCDSCLPGQSFSVSFACSSSALDL